MIDRSLFETKTNVNSPAGNDDARLWNFCKLCSFVTLQGTNGNEMDYQSIKMHLVKKHKYRFKCKYCGNAIEVQDEFN